MSATKVYDDNRSCTPPAAAADAAVAAAPPPPPASSASYPTTIHTERTPMEGCEKKSTAWPSVKPDVCRSLFPPDPPALAALTWPSLLRFWQQNVYYITLEMPTHLLLSTPPPSLPAAAACPPSFQLSDVPESDVVWKSVAASLATSSSYSSAEHHLSRILRVQNQSRSIHYQTHRLTVASPGVPIDSATFSQWMSEDLSLSPLSVDANEKIVYHAPKNNVWSILSQGLDPRKSHCGRSGYAIYATDSLSLAQVYANSFSRGKSSSMQVILRCRAVVGKTFPMDSSTKMSLPMRSCIPEYQSVVQQSFAPCHEKSLEFAFYSADQLVVTDILFLSPSSPSSTAQAPIAACLSKAELVKACHEKHTVPHGFFALLENLRLCVSDRFQSATLEAIILEFLAHHRCLYTFYRDIEQQLPPKFLLQHRFTQDKWVKIHELLHGHGQCQVAVWQHPSSSTANSSTTASDFKRARYD